MSAPDRKAYTFASSDQWGACLTSGLRADGAELAGFDPLARAVASTTPARLVARLANGELIWIDLFGRLHVEGCGDALPRTFAAPTMLAGAQRIVAVRGGLWALDAEGELSRLSASSFQRLNRFRAEEFGAERILDVAGDGRDGIEILVDGAGGRCLLARNHRTRRFRPAFVAPADARQLAILRGPRRRVLLLDDVLRFVRGDAGFDVALAAIAPNLTAVSLTSDGRDRLFLAAVDRVAADWRRRVFILDGNGEVAATLEVGTGDQPHWPLGLAAARDAVWIADDSGLLAFTPDPRATSAAVLITPLLISPEQAERGWLRAEIEAGLAVGSRLTLSHFSTSDSTLRAEIAAIRSNPAVPPGRRRRQLEQRLQGLWTVSADIEISGDEPATLIAPLYAAEGAALLVRISLAHPGGSRARLRRLRVLYPELSLARRLPAIFRNPTGDGDGFLRKLVSVLEATTQDLEGRIERLGSLVDPQTAPEGWLDFLAGWFGTPWHQDLPPDAKRRLLLAMPDLLRSRGTRAGLLRLFAELLPGTRIGMTDTAVEYRPTVLAGRGAGGVTLPAILLGRPRGLAGLGEARARLGRMRLRCPTDSDDPFARPGGRVRLALSMSAAERRDWEPILKALLSDFIPAGLVLDLRWRGAAGDGLGRRLDVNRLAGRPRAVLGGGISLGRAVLDGEGPNLADGALAAGLRLT